MPSKKYEIDFWVIRARSQKLAAHVEIEREHLMSRDVNDIIYRTLFKLACKGVKFNFLSAIVNRDGEKVLHYRCITECYGAEIASYIEVARPRERYRRVRKMMVAC